MAQPSEGAINYNIYSDHPFFKFGNEHTNMFDKFLFYDSIFAFYPIVDIVFTDRTAKTAELFAFSDGQEFSVKIGNDTYGHLEHSYTLIRGGIDQMVPAPHIAGTHKWRAVSSMYNNDSSISASHEGRLCDRAGKKSIVEKIIEKYNFPSSLPITSPELKRRRMKLSRTFNDGIFYQRNLTDEQFLQRAMEYAYPQDQQKGSTAPFLSFWNNYGEFYFMDLWSMISQEPVANYVFYEKDKGALTGAKFVDPSILFLGVQRQKYNVTFFSHRSDGSAVSQAVPFGSMNIPYGNKKSGHPLKQSFTQSPGEVRYLGLEQTPQDRDMIRGRRNYHYIGSQTAYRCRTKVSFNPELRAGATINLEVESGYTDDKIIASEYSGKWIIFSAQHLFLPHEPEKQPASFLELIKPSLHLYERNALINEYIKD